MKGKKNRKNRILAVILSALLVTSLAACGNNSSTSDTQETEAAVSDAATQDEAQSSDTDTSKAKKLSESDITVNKYAGYVTLNGTNSGAVQETAYKLWIVPLEARDFDGKQVTLFFATDFQKNTSSHSYFK